VVTPKPASHGLEAAEYHAELSHWLETLETGLVLLAVHVIAWCSRHHGLLQLLLATDE
jgi:hypothetical protein